MNHSDIINVNAGNSLVVYAKSYNFLVTTNGIVNPNNITCYNETTNSYVYSNVNNQITVTNENGKMTLNLNILRNNIYTLTFKTVDFYSENKEYKLRIKGV